MTLISAFEPAAAAIWSFSTFSRCDEAEPMLASQHPWRVVAFGGASPGVAVAQAPFRQVTITGPDAGDLAASLAMVRAQNAPYQPAQAAIVRLPGGQGVPRGQLALRIDFAAPSPLGLLTGGASG